MVYLTIFYKDFHSSVLSYDFSLLKHIQIDRRKSSVHFKAYLHKNFFLCYCMLNNFPKFGRLLTGKPVFLRAISVPNFNKILRDVFKDKN